MRFLLRPVCWSIGWYHLVANQTNIAGHDYREEEPYERDGRIYEPLRCARCGQRDIGWYDPDNPPIQL